MISLCVLMMMVMMMTTTIMLFGAIIRCVWNWFTLWMLRNMQKKYKFLNA